MTSEDKFIDVVAQSRGPKVPYFYWEARDKAGTWHSEFPRQSGGGTNLFSRAV